MRQRSAGDDRRPRKRHVAVRASVYDNRVPFAEFTLEQPHGQRLHDLLLDGSLQRSRAIDRVETGPRQLELGGWRQLEGHLAFGKPLAQSAQLDGDDALDLL